MDISGFDWDDGNKAKCQKHGVSVFEIEYVMEFPIGIFPDIVHSGNEQGFRAVGKSLTGRFIFIAFTVRIIHDEQKFRPLSARYMHKKEVNSYEKENPNLSFR